jgi:hypothetical protein
MLINTDQEIEVYLPITSVALAKDHAWGVSL